jgi:Ser/Thr protein kinase RdoA (MazF antagonist)
MSTSLPMTTTSAAAASAAVAVAAGFGVMSAEPVILSDGANVIVHLSPSPVAAKVAATTMLVRPDVAAWLQRELDAAERTMLGEAFTRLMAELDPGSCIAQPLHGDAGAGNLMAAGTGWIWHDFEDTCSGPVAWDLAASTASQRMDGARILAAYGAPVDTAQLAVCEQLRRLHLTVWYALYAERLPEHRQRAAELLASWQL